MARSMIEQLEEDFMRKLKKTASKIRSKAAGRICGDCKHAVTGSVAGGFCSARTNFRGEAIEIVRPSAVACASWSRA